MNRQQAIDMLKATAVQHALDERVNKRDTPYLQHAVDDPTWLPHEWVIAAVLAAHDRAAHAPVVTRLQRALDVAQGLWRADHGDATANLEGLAFNARNALRDLLEALGGDMPATHKHIGRQTLYRELNRGLLQTDTPAGDMTPLVAYEGTDGVVWYRRATEFDEPTRFVKLACPAS